MSPFLVTAVLRLSVACAALWLMLQRERKAGKARDQLWRNALSAIAAHDYEGAGAFAAMIEDGSGEGGTRRDGKSLYVTLRQLMRTIESLEIAEREQQRARRGFEDVLSSLQDGVLVVDSEARLRYLNATAVGFFGVRVEDVLGAQLLEALPSFGLDAAVRLALENGKHNAREVHLYSPRQREIFLRVAPVRQNDGSVTGAVAILQDLTEMRRLERVRRDFVANASHELRTPIATIRAAAETITDATDDPEVVQRFLPHLVSEAERLSRLVTDLLDLARAEQRSEQQKAARTRPWLRPGPHVQNRRTHQEHRRYLEQRRDGENRGGPVDCAPASLQRFAGSVGDRQRQCHFRRVNFSVRRVKPEQRAGEENHG